MDDLPFLPTVTATRNRLAELMGSIGQGAGKAVDWLAGGAQAGAEPTLALMRGDALDQPFLPTAESGGRIGAIASAVGSTLMPVGAPTGALGAGPVLRRASPEQFSAANKSVGDVSSGAVETIPVERLMYGQNNVLPEHVAGYTANPERISARPLYGMAHGDDVILLDGHHRATAAAELGLPDLPVEVLRGRALDMSPEARAARAAEQGYAVDVYHGTPEDFPAFDLSKSGSNVGASDSNGVFMFTNDPGYAGEFTWKGGERTGQVMPLKLKMDDPLYVDFYNRPYDSAKYREAIDAARAAGNDGVVIANRVSPFGQTSDDFVVFDPANIRSRFAAFDPARAGDSDLLASRAGVPAVPPPQPPPEDPATAAARNAWVLEHIRRGGT